ncbi:hypothetical protein BD779DRAFT_510769 [Infundibulicybe gibba]|nr:hypothetical protein BD779DRAFT_510769 [Infundibulicybe gibba]
MSNHITPNPPLEPGAKSHVVFSHPRSLFESNGFPARVSWSLLDSPHRWGRKTYPVQVRLCCMRCLFLPTFAFHDKTLASPTRAPFRRDCCSPVCRPLRSLLLERKKNSGKKKHVHEQHWVTWLNLLIGARLQLPIDTGGALQSSSIQWSPCTSRL